MVVAFPRDCGYQYCSTFGLRFSQNSVQSFCFGAGNLNPATRSALRAADFPGSASGAASEVDRPTVDRKSRLRPEFDRHRDLGDQVPGPRADDVDPEDPVGDPRLLEPIRRRPQPRVSRGGRCRQHPNLRITEAQPICLSHCGIEIRGRGAHQ